ncbi:hypothetical protein QJS10_CPB14g01089 [Acorus calamus]|uniref:HPt domain-containing protein n=1 Tax=Acorus calamus TaxID=4465 RepID=A0AAV9DDS0_ACOCL|nr:hypothetical protein QJS10_CPB14g01089 [Acorus calamus]
MIPIFRSNKCVRVSQFRFFNRSEELGSESADSEWRGMAFAKVIKLTHTLKGVGCFDGRLINIIDKATVTEDCIVHEMRDFLSLAKALIDPSIANMSSNSCSLILNYLSKVCDILGVSAQQRKSVRLAVCSQVTQHHIMRATLQQVLMNLKSDMGDSKYQSGMREFQMGEQVLSSCIDFLEDSMEISDPKWSSWMRSAPVKKFEESSPPRKWSELLEMFEDLTKCLVHEERLASHVSKVHVMKEGLFQIKTLLVEKDISYKQSQRQDCIVQRRLSKCLGLPSRCLFTLLLYYLFGSVRDIHVEFCGGIQRREGSESRFVLCVGKVLTCADEEMVLSGVKELNKGLVLFRLVWDSAGMKGELELEGHLWCVGAEERSFTYRGNAYFVHEIKP